MVPRTTRLIFLAARAIRRIPHTENQNLVTVTRSPRVVNQSHILTPLMENQNIVMVTKSPRVVNQNHIHTGNRAMGKVTVLTRAVMVDPTEGMVRVLFNM